MQLAITNFVPKLFPCKITRLYYFKQVTWLIKKSYVIKTTYE